MKGYKYSVVTNVHGSWANHALMMGMPKDTPVKEQFHELNRRWDKFPVPPVILPREKAMCKENTISENINLFDVLPLYRINDQDGGFFLSKAAVVTGDPAEPDNLDKQNVGIYRIQVKDIDRIGIQALPFHDIAIQLAKAEEVNEPLPVAIALGNTPLVSFMASTPVNYDQNEYEFVGALQDGVPTEITKADTAEHLYVPAHAEVILEGYIMPRVRTCEGPFGEFPGSYSGARNQCEIKITHITHRTNPIFENLYLGMPWTEIDYLMALNTSVPLYKQLKATMPEVQAVNAMYTHGIGVIILRRSVTAASVRVLLSVCCLLHMVCLIPRSLSLSMSLSIRLIWSRLCGRLLPASNPVRMLRSSRIVQVCRLIRLRYRQVCMTS